MSAILQNWISTRLHQDIKWHPDEFGDVMKDGHIISQLLHSYGVINDEQVFLTRKTTDIENIKINWRYLSLWLKETDIYVEHILPQILTGERSILLKVFYQLFLYLDKRDRVEFVRKEKDKTSKLLRKINDKFRVVPIEEPSEKPVEVLAAPLVAQEHLTEWYQKKVAEIEHTMSYLRSRVSRFKETKTAPCFVRPKKSVQKLQNKEKVDMDNFEKRHGTILYTYQELKEMQNEPRFEIDDDEKVKWSEKYLETLHDTQKNRKAEIHMQKALQNELRASTWKDLIDKSEASVDYDMAKCVMKLSQFEKQMCSQLMEIKQQTRNIIQNRIQLDRELAAERELQFQTYMENLRRQTVAQEDETLIERQRQNELHRRLIAKKMRAVSIENYKYCFSITEDLVDISIKFATTRLLFGYVPEQCIRNWKNLFYKTQPIFERSDGISSLLSSSEENYEEVFQIEKNRQNCMDDADFYDYHKLTGEWATTLLKESQQSIIENEKHSILSNIVIAHVIYTILNAKYPFPLTRSPFDLPIYTSKSIVLGLKDISLTVPMQALLKERNVLVVRVESAVNYCLQQFKKESSNFSKVIFSYDKIKNIPEESQSLFNLIKMELEHYPETPESSVDELDVDTELDKITQTPSVFPADISFSTSGELGLSIHETLSIGKKLSDTQLCKAIAEYLRSIPNIKGFVLVNYPNNFEQAQELEEILTGCRCLCEIKKYDDQSHVDELDKDELKEKRQSALYEDPHDPICVENDTFFTSFIKLKFCDDIYNADFIWDLNQENSELIERFYADKGINYSLYYTEVDKELLCLICQYVIGDFEMPLKDYSSLFGKDVYENLDISGTEGKHNVSRLIKGELSINKISKAKLANSSKSLSLHSVSNSADIQVESFNLSEIQEEEYGEIDEVIEDNFEEAISESTVHMPGESEWMYAQTQQSSDYLSALGSIWELSEKNYIDNMRFLFFGRRLLLANLIPYVRFIGDKTDEVFRRSNAKQDIINEFVEEYNNFNPDWRVHLPSKIEWHCRAMELQQKLNNVCDSRKKIAEEEKNSIISDNWSVQESNILANIYISSMQTELNRTVITYQILQDFYQTILKPLPSLDDLSSKELQWIPNDIESASFASDVGKKSNEKVHKSKKISNDSQNVSTPFNESNNPYYLTMETNVKNSQKHAQDIYDSFISIIQRETIDITKENPSSDNLKSFSQLLVFERDNKRRALAEWNIALEGELKRLFLRLELLLKKAIEDLKMLHDCINKAFISQQDKINENYSLEIKAVENLIKFIQVRIEEEKPLPTSIKFSDTHFTFAEEEQETTPPTIREESPVFKVGQLAYLLEQLKLVAPQGFILAGTLAYLVQDFLLFARETCNLPKMWYFMESESVLKLVQEVYGGCDFIDWRGFLIYALDLRIPEVYEVLNAVNSFKQIDLRGEGIVSLKQFKKVQLWDQLDPFKEVDVYMKFKIYMIRAFLFEAIKYDEDRMDFRQFLYFFCRHKDPCYGFAKAVCVAVGRKIRYEYECIPIVEDIIQRRKERDILHMEAVNLAYKLIHHLIERVLKYCEGVSVQDLTKYQKEASTQKLQISSKTYGLNEPKDDSEYSTRIVSEDAYMPEYEFTVPAEVISKTIARACPWLDSMRGAKSNVKSTLESLEQICEHLSYDTDNEEVFLCFVLKNPIVEKYLTDNINKFKLVPFYEWVERHSFYKQK